MFLPLFTLSSDKTMQDINNEKPLRAIAVLAIAFLFVLCYESQRVQTLLVSHEDGFVKSLASKYIDGAEKIKKALGLTSFFRFEAVLWAELKNGSVVSGPEASSLRSVSATSVASISDISIKPVVQKPAPPYNILIVGDSFIAEKFGPSLEKELLAFKDVSVLREGIYSTGLSRPDYFNWNQKIKDLLASYKANVVVVMFGANDAQDIKTVGGKAIHYGDSEQWKIAYGNRVKNFLEIFQQNGITVFWVGNPIAKTVKYSNRMSTLNSVYEQEVKDYPSARFISTWEMLMGPDGKYSDYLKDEDGKMRLARASDGIHASSFGASIMVKEVLKKIKEDLSLELKE